MTTRILLTFVTLLASTSTAHALEFHLIDDKINEFFTPLSAAALETMFYSVPIAGVSFPLIVGWLVLAATIFTIYFKFAQFRKIGHSFAILRGDYDKPGETGEISHFKALTTALSGTVGLGNIAGVAVAVSLGGPGATFWMIVAGLLGMSTKFAEAVLGVKYRQVNADGSISGGPMYYLTQGFAERGLGGIGKLLAIMFAVCCIGGAIGGGNMFQVNQSFDQFVTVTGGAESFFAGKGWLFGLIVAAVIGSVIIGGIKSIANVTSKLVPLMAVVYLGAGMVILAINYGHIGWAVSEIFAGAFTGQGVIGGAIGALIVGFQRAAFSNEAGIGSAAIAHAAVKTDEPVTQGYVAMLGPFFDTVVVCAMTALIIIVSEAHLTDLSGVQLTSAAFETVLPWFPILLTVAVILFALSTAIAWFYFGLKSWTYLVGESRKKDLCFKLIFCAFTVVGASADLAPVIDFSDVMIFAMSIPNVIGLYLLMPVVKAEVEKYWQKMATGEISSNRRAFAT
ncbi:alanine:cation symporter family protein [Sneathiella marina]|uniref:Alanine:cation symporter family protein n=1 Tax=Sneathiella marina TaxID=2950108 RepID=A0ABY4W419_9PROT|nr:alanine/glycine:cation symporter family protein [Sneathiella marina]USG61717.1 alanine:cation symporter family protein [Sneathiella marina]